MGDLSRFYRRAAPYRIEVKAFFSVPKSWSKKRTTAALFGRIVPTKKPDGDNLLKIICDSLNHVLAVDDSWAVECSVVKRFAELPRVEVCVAFLDLEASS